MGRVSNRWIKRQQIQIWYQPLPKCNLYISFSEDTVSLSVFNVQKGLYLSHTAYIQPPTHYPT